jgi:hypothetical protein
MDKTGVILALEPYSIAKHMMTWVLMKKKSPEVLNQANSGIVHLSHETQCSMIWTIL